MPLYDFNQLVQTAQESKPRFTVLDPGDYEFVIDEVPEVNNEKYYLKVKAKVASGERAKHPHFLYISYKPDIKPFAAKQTVDFLSACGISPDQLQSAGSWENIANALLGRRFAASVTVEPNTYNGETKDQNRVQDFRPSTAAPSVGPGAPAQQAPSGPTPTQAAQQEAPNPWGQATQQPTPPQQGNGPTTSFQPPPMPFGNNG